MTRESSPAIACVGSTLRSAPLRCSGLSAAAGTACRRRAPARHRRSARLRAARRSARAADGWSACARGSRARPPDSRPAASCCSRLRQRFGARAFAVRAQALERFAWRVLACHGFDVARDLQFDDGLGFARGFAAAAAVVFDRALEVVDGVEEDVLELGHIGWRCRAARPGRAATSADAGAWRARRRPAPCAGSDRARRWRRSRRRLRPGGDRVRTAAARSRRGAWPGPARGRGCGWRPAGASALPSPGGARPVRWFRRRRSAARWIRPGARTIPAPAAPRRTRPTPGSRRCGCRCARAWRWRRRAGTGGRAGCPGVPARARRRPGFLHLAEDLRLAQHQRIQAGGDAEQVAHRIGVVVRVEIGVQVAGIVRMGREPVGQRAAVVVGDGVELGAVAGGQQRDFAHRRQRAQRRQRAPAWRRRENATRSRRLTGAVWWLMPRTNRLITTSAKIPFRGLR